MSRVNRRMMVEIALISLYLLISFTILGALRVVLNSPIPEPIYVEAAPIEAEVVYTSAPPKVINDPATIPVPEESLVESVEDEIWDDSLEYLAMCVEAEAGNQTELGKRLVCDVVLNRYDSGKYDTLYDVINEKSKGVHQFSVVGDGRIFEVIPTEATYKIVAEELENRTNTEVLYFRTQHYHTFGTPLFQEDDHYFSK